MSNLSVNNIEKNSCCGCKGCAEICPKKAITFETDSEGFWYPVVDEKVCNNCGLCKAKCPNQNTKSKEDNTRNVYAAWNRDQSVRLDSTSGGVYHALASFVLSKNGFLVGSQYSEDYKSAFHSYTDNAEGLDKLVGSKYFQSDTEGIYSKTKELLKTEKPVLFVGTPCQVKALYDYLGDDYANLITIDFVCKGVPSPLIHSKKIELYETKERSKVVFYRDKYDKQAWVDFGELVKFENGKEKFISRWKDDINNCFVEKNINIRPSCYSCTYKGKNYFSDITIGDFWGISAVTEHDNKRGVSLLFANSIKGQDLIEAAKEYLYLEKRTYKETLGGNPAILEAAQRPANRDKFFEDVSANGLEYAVKKYAKKDLSRKISDEKKVIKSRLRKWIPIVKDRKYIDWIQFIKYNYYCKEVKRDSDAFLVPCKGAVVQIKKGAKVVLHGNAYLNYYPCYKKAGQRTLFQVASTGEFIANNRIEIAYGNTISVDDNAVLEMGYLFTGVNTNIVCHHKISIGNNVMLGRDVCVFDSDYHKIYDINEEIINDDKPVYIEDCAWIGARSMVLKGSHIERGAIVSANSMVMGNVESNKVFINKREMKSVGQNVMWRR